MKKKSKPSKRKPAVIYRKSGKLVEVIWGDAWGTSGWQSKSSIKSNHGPLYVKSYGVVLIHDEKGISFSEGKDENGGDLGHNFIPAAMIIKTRVIE